MLHIAMAFLSPDQRRTLDAICETFIPALYADGQDDARLFGLSAQKLDTATQVETALERITAQADREQIALVLSLLENGAFNGLTAQTWKGFSDLDIEGRTDVLRTWGDSSIPAARKLFQTLKRLTLFLFYSTMPDNEPNPAWSAFNYNGQPIPSENGARPIKPLDISQDTTLYTDVLVIGSGAGGGVVAGELSAAGQDVIVVEKGGYYSEPDFHGREQTSSQELFEKFGSLTTADVSMNILAGSTLGGGTTINWTASLRTPDHVLREWARDFGFSGATTADFQHSLDAVMQRMNVNEAESIANGTNARLEKGCKALNYDVTVIPRNVKGCEECGFCNFGCSFGAKQGTLKTYLQDAHTRGARILVRAHVERVLHERGLVSGAKIQVQDADGKPHTVTVHAKKVVVAAGAIHTPALLLRSGLVNSNIGANLHLHPVTVTYGIFEEAIHPWHGAPMSRLSAQFANLDGKGYGVRLETAPVHPGISALTFPWQSGRAHKRMMGNLNHMANIIILTRDFYGGRVAVDRDGQPLVHYQLNPYDARHLMRGTLESMRVHLAAGAHEICSPHNNALVYRPADGGDFEAFLKQVEARGFQPNAYMLFSAHQMSSCRIGGNSATGAIDPSGETYEVKNLFVADGSALPTASGVNPMVTIMGTAHYLAQQIKAR
jgi:choline dehydrogenase-like flavoprotein